MPIKRTININKYENFLFFLNMISEKAKRVVTDRANTVQTAKLKPTNVFIWLRAIKLLKIQKP